MIGLKVRSGDESLVLYLLFYVPFLLFEWGDG